MYGGVDRVDDGFETADVSLAQCGTDGVLQLVERAHDAPSLNIAPAREADYERSTVVRVQLATDELALLEPVEHVRQGRALRPELAVQARDRRRTVPCEMREDVGLRLRDPGLAAGALNAESNQVSSTLKVRKHRAQIIYSEFDE